ncbi:MAG: winged helix-turn-helix transcriptional regulator [Kiritimatiellae bacterium]|nr:winged helix-turn-helix transcriptional regulator [Kiritimatiellia bacterium]
MSKRRERVDFEKNKRDVCLLLRRHPDLSRQQLSDMTGLHRSTISKVIRQYIEAGMIEEMGKIMPHQKRVGKYQVRIGIRDDIGWSLGVGLSAGRADLAVLGASGSLLRTNVMPFDTPLSSLPPLLSRHLETWFERDGAPPGDCAAVGVSTSGQVDEARERLLHCCELAVDNYDLAREWSGHFSCPVRVFNGLQAETLCHVTNPVRPDSESFLYLRLQCRPAPGGHDISAAEVALVFRGELYTGVRGQAGRFFGPLQQGSHAVVSDEELAMLGDINGGSTVGLDALSEILANVAISAVGWTDIDRVILGGAVIPRNELFMQGLNARAWKILSEESPDRKPVVEPARVHLPAAAYSAGLLACEWAPMSFLRAEPREESN